MSHVYTFLIALLICLAFVNAQGTIFLMGGAIEDDNSELYGALKSCSSSIQPKIAIFCSGAKDMAAARSAYYDDYTDEDGVIELSYCHVFEKYGFAPVFIPIALDNYTAEAYNQANVDLVNACEMAFFNGGDQSRHARVLLKDDGSDTPLMAAVRSLYSRGGVIAGTSAGNAVQGKTIYGEGNSIGYLYHNKMAIKKISDVSLQDPNDRHNHNGGISKGFGFLENYDAIPDTHFDARGRLGRMIVALRETQYPIGIGVDENTAFMIKNGTGQVVGEYGVFIVDASTANFPNTSYFCTTNIRLHYLTSGDSYHFTSKTVVSSKPLITLINHSVQDPSHIFGTYQTTKTITELAQSYQDAVNGKTYDPNGDVSMTFYVKFYKTSATTAYKKAEKYTITNLSLDINY